CVSTKVCRVCKLEQPISKFLVNGASLDGHRYTCVGCEAILEAKSVLRQREQQQRDERKPSQVTEDYFVHWENTKMSYPSKKPDSGKWLVFLRKGKELDAMWEQVKQAERYTQELDQPPRGTAPEWMKEALERWEREDS